MKETFGNQPTFCVCCDGHIAGINYVPPLEGNKEGNPDWFGTGEEIPCLCVLCIFILCDDVVCGRTVFFFSLIIQTNQAPCSCYPQWLFRTQFLFSLSQNPETCIVIPGESIHPHDQSICFIFLPRSCTASISFSLF